MTDFAAPTRIAATFAGGSLDGKWSYLPEGAPDYRSPTGERYELDADATVWHSLEDSVLSHQVYRLAQATPAGEQGQLSLGRGAQRKRGGMH